MRRTRTIAAAAAAAALALTGLMLTQPYTASAATPTGPTLVADVNGDGVVDVVSLFRLPLADLDELTYEEGEIAYRQPASLSVHYGGTDRIDTVSQADLVVDPVGDTWDGMFGQPVVADLNRDGYSDVVVSDLYDDTYNGVVWALWGSKDGISAANSTRLLTGANRSTLGRSMAFVAEPSPMLIVGDNTVDDGQLMVYPVNSDGTLGTVEKLTGLSMARDANYYTVSASNDLLVVGNGGAVVNGHQYAGAIDIVRFLADGTWIKKRVTQATSGVPGGVENYDEFGASVSVLNGYIAVGVPREKVGTVVGSGMIQPLRVTSTGRTLTVKALPYATPANLHLYRPTKWDALGTSVQVYRICTGKYGVAAVNTNDSGKHRVVRVPFTRTSTCKPKVLTTAGWGSSLTIKRTSPAGTGKETVVVNTGPRQLRYVTYGQASTIETFAGQQPEINYLAAPTP